MDTPHPQPYVELLSQVLRDRSRNLAREIAARYPTIKDLYDAPWQEIASVPGIGPAKAKQIEAIMEIGKLLMKPQVVEKVFIHSPQDVYDLLAPEMRLLDRERFQSLLLSTKHKIMTIETVSVGGLDSTIIHPRELFKNPLRRSAAAVILCHNHPSGDPTPSQEDTSITLRLSEAGKILGIQVLDHIIIGNETYVSMKEKGII